VSDAVEIKCVSNNKCTIIFNFGITVWDIGIPLIEPISALTPLDLCPQLYSSAETCVGGYDGFAHRYFIFTLNDLIICVTNEIAGSNCRSVIGGVFAR
jgi:hypothetical protein